jgi:hypothetical protein
LPAYSRVCQAIQQVILNQYLAFAEHFNRRFEVKELGVTHVAVLIGKLKSAK